MTPDPDVEPKAAVEWGEDSESVEYVRATIGTHFEAYTGHVEKTQSPFGGMVETGREIRQEGFVEILST